MPGLAPAHMPKGSSQAAAWGGGLPVRARLLPLAPEALQLSGFKTPWQHLQQPPRRRCRSSSASPCLPTSARVPVTALVPRCPHCHSSPPRCRGSGTAGSMQGSCHGTRRTGNMAEPGSLPPACGQPARPGKARDSLGLPAQEPFPPALPGHSPTGGSSLASSFQAGAGGLGSGLSCASPGHSPSPRAWGWAMPGRAMGHRCLTAVCSGGGCRARARLPVLPAPRQAPWLREFVGRVLAACSQGGGGKPLVLRWANHLMCSGRALPVQTSISSTVGWQWRNGSAGGSCGRSITSCPHHSTGGNAAASPGRLTGLETTA